MAQKHPTNVGQNRSLRLAAKLASGPALASVVWATATARAAEGGSAGSPGAALLACAAPGLLAAAALALGACNGSLAELISRRLPAQRSLWWPPSACEACGHRLRFWHNLPLISYPCLLGCCAFCRALIPPRSWAVELVMAALGWALWWRLGLSLPLLLWLPLTVPIMAVALCDLDHWWVPDLLTLATAFWVLVCACLPGGPPWSLVVMGLVPAALLSAVAWAFARLRGFEGLGQGDIKWAAVMGAAVTGPAACSMIFWASCQGAAAALIWRFWRALRPPDAAPGVPLTRAVPAALADDADWRPPPGALPFAPFIGLAALETVIFPDLFSVGVAPLLAVMGYPAPTG